MTPPPPVDSSQIVDLKKGLLLYLPFSGNFADSSGNNNPTAPSNGISLTSDASGTSSHAISGTGNGESVIVTNNGSIKFDSAFTVSVNVLTNDPQQMQAYVTMTRYADAKGTSFGFGQGIPGITAAEIAVAKSSMTCDDIVEAGNPTANTIADTSNLTLQASSWYNLVATFHKGTIKIYANGTLISTKTGADATVPICPSAQVIVGAWFGGGESINGKLDEVRMYNRALNDKEIAQLGQGFPHQEPLSVVDLKKGLLLYLPFNGSIADSSGNNNPTQLAGDASLTTDENGVANSAYGSDGNSGALIVTNNGSIKFDSTLSASFNVMTRTTSLQTYINMVKNSDATGLSFSVGEGIPGYPLLEAGVSTTPNICGNIVTPNNTLIDTSNTTLQPDSWYNVVYTFNKGIQNIYLNGALISHKRGAVQTVTVCSDAQVLIGSWWNGSESLNGKMDEVRVYNRELNSEEIATLAGGFHNN